VGIGAALALVSGGLAVGQVLPFIKSTIKGRTKPSRIACAISLCCNVLMVVSLTTTGNSSGLVLPAVFTVTGLLSLVLAIKYGISGFTRTDIIAGLAAAVAITAWLVLGANAAVIGTNTAQVTALIATFNKLRKNPGTEDLLSWSIGGMAALCSLGAVVFAGTTGAGLSLASLIMPTRCVLSCLVILGLAFMQHRANVQNRAPQVAHVSHFPFAKQHHNFDLAA